MITIYGVPADLIGTLMTPGLRPEPRTTGKQLQFTEPPLLIEDRAVFKFGTWLLSVPRSAVIVAHYDGQRGWNEFGV